MYKFRFLLFGVISLAFLPCVKAMYIDEVVALALSNNYTLNAKRAQLDSIFEAEGIARSYFFPQVDLSGSISRNSSTNSYSNEDDSYSTLLSTPYNVTATVKQFLLDMETISSYDKAVLFLNREELSLGEEINNVVIQAVEAYLHVLSAQEELKATKAQLEYLQSYFNEIQNKVRVGNATNLDLSEVKAQLKFLEYTLIADENTLVLRNDSLNRIINEKVALEATIVDNLNLVVADLPLSEAMQWVRDNNISIILADMDVRMAELDVDINQYTYYPILSLFGNYQYSSGLSANDTIDRTNLSAGIQLSMNLYSGGMTSAKSKQLLSQKNSVMYLRSELQNDIMHLAVQYYNNVYNGLAQIEALQVTQDSVHEVLISIRQSYDVGLKTNNDVLIATKNYFDTKRDLVQVKYSVLASVIKFKSLGSILTVEEVASLNNFLRYE